MTIRDALHYGKQTLAAVPDPEIDTAALLCRATGLPKLELLLRASDTLSLAQETRFRELLARREKREPLQYILGTQCFYGLDFAVDRRVLIPRQETETLCELAIERLQALSKPRVLDVCTGSGAIAVTIKHECPSADVTAIDLSADALEVAQANAASNRADVRFLHGDLFAPVAGERFDCILSNPPYIGSEACKTLQDEVLREPLMALDGGSDGLDFYRRLAVEAPSHLNAKGLLLMEIGDTQGTQVVKLLTDAGFADVCIHRDLYGLDRVAYARMAAFPT